MSTDTLDAQVSPQLFATVAEAASTEESRYYLRGVYIEPATNGGVNLVATTGHIMLFAWDRDGYTNRSAIISYPPKRPIKTWWPNNDGWATKLCLDGKMGYIYSASDALYHAEPLSEIDGTFPDYGRVVPDKTSNELAQFEWQYLVRLEKAIKRSGFWKPVLHFNGLSPAIFKPSGQRNNENHIYGIIMPMRV